MEPLYLCQKIKESNLNYLLSVVKNGPLYLTKNVGNTDTLPSFRWKSLYTEKWFYEGTILFRTQFLLNEVMFIHLIDYGFSN